MRAEVDLAPAPPIVLQHVRRPGRRLSSGPGWRPDWFELSMLGLFALLSVWVLGLDLWQVVAHGRAWTGTDGIYIVDQMQYLAWIQSAAHHFLVSNMFVLRGTPADYFMPAVAISGGLTALGVPAWLSLLLWKPVAVAATFFAVRAYAHRSLDGTWERRVVLALGLFFSSATLIYGSWGTVGDLFVPFLSWGYTFGLMALAAMVFAILAYDRARGAGARQIGWVPALLGALSSSLHPWQGELLIVIVLGAELLGWLRDRRRPALALPLMTLLGTGLPLLYYLVLGHADLSWQLARVAMKHSFSIFTILLAVVPLVVPALVAYRRWPTTFLGLMTRVWPGAAFAIYVISGSSVSATPLHAFEGIAIPLAVLAVEGLRRLRFERLPLHQAVAALAVAVFTIPGIIYLMHYSKQAAAPSPGNPNFITSDEHHALRYLAHDPIPGGVFARFYLGAAVPGATGRQTFVGHCLWSEPNCAARAVTTQQVIAGTLSAEKAQNSVQQSGARFVLADCKARPNLQTVLRPITQSVTRFGCAAVYTLKAASAPSPALAESPPHAALRATGRQQRRVQHT